MKRKIPLTGIAASVAMLLVIIDTRTALISVQTGIELCLSVVIPSLFPFIVLSGLITSAFIGRENIFMRRIGSECRIPAGCESLLLIGWISGYPIGAQCIYQAYQKGQLSKQGAERMLGFCNNAGPAFIFGIVPTLLESKMASWFLWGIQIFASLLIGLIIPGTAKNIAHNALKETTNFPSTVIKSVKSMGIICGWVVLARVLIGYLDAYIFVLIPIELAVLIQGLLELSNGCIALTAIKTESIRFILLSGILSFGGLCVWMQTSSVTGDLSKKTFFIGKLCQTLISILVSVILCPVLFHDNRNNIHNSIYFTAAGILGLLISLIIAKKVVALRKEVLYNIKKIRKKGDTYAFPKEASPLL